MKNENKKTVWGVRHYEGKILPCFRGGRKGRTFRSVKDYNRKAAKAIRFE
jgi:hypothetical protein